MFQGQGRAASRTCVSLLASGTAVGGTSLRAQGAACDEVGLRVAGLELWLDARESGVPLAVPGCHAPFTVAGAAGGGLTLYIRDGPLHSTEGWQPLFYDAETWQLWRDPAGRQVFVTSNHSPPPRQIAVDPAFRGGEVIGQFRFSVPPGQAVYPLQDMDIILFANWLASLGDLILHACGIEDEGAGYAFVGPSGAGKSTLASELASRPSVTVLGEDQVIVRHQEGQFVIYGTPWHTNPARCSPRGAPLKKLFFLDRMATHGVEPCQPGRGVERLLQDSFIPYYNHAGVARILDTLSRLAEQVPFHFLGFQLGADVVKLIQEA